MNRLTFLATIVAALMSVLPAQADTTRTVTYVTPPGGVYTDTIAGTVGVGGYYFAANGEIPKRIKIADVTGTETAFRVCQDRNDDKICGDTEVVKGCAPYDTTVTIQSNNWSRTLPIAVSIRSGDTQQCDDTEATTSIAGTIAFTTG